MACVKRAIIVGGGISGMTLAIVLQRQGIEAHVIEKARPKDQLGTGINLQQNALRALSEADVLKDCLAEGFPWNTVTTRDASGALLDISDLPWEVSPGMPGALGIMRTALADILAHHAQEAGVKASYQTSVAMLEQHDKEVVLGLSDGSTQRADIVVAAAGVYSQIREMVFGGRYRPKYAGQGVWRYTVPRPESLQGFTIYRTEKGDTLGCLPLSSKLAYYFHLETSEAPKRFRDDELAKEMARRMSVFDAPKLREAMEQISPGRHISFRRFDILLMPQPWYRGRVVLLGDAAHSLTPQLTSGAGMAVEDAVVLADCLSKFEDIAEALPVYGERREKRVRPIYENSLRICEMEKVRHPDKSEAVKLFVDSFGLLKSDY